FVTRKITSGAAKIQKGLLDKIYLGNLSSKRDWGYAPEYVEAMWKILDHVSPSDYVIATGQTHSVREFCEETFKCIGADLVWEGKDVEEKGIDRKTGKVLVEVDPKYFRPAEVDLLIGDSAKAKKELGWEPKVKFKELVSIMVEADIKLLEKKGESGLDYFYL
ncbi:MAG: GDP-mannose 4,6-dehydratase, partial [Candidatus Omnitrophica bacterium]|nr:GDP-mannose 4,6-dehydratase [Candidatus Omnitrophota bacterium]